MLRSSPLGIVVAILIGLAGLARAQAPQSEAEIKAAVVLNLLFFVEWPAASLSDELRLCYFDDGALAIALEGLSGRTVQGRRLIAKKVDQSPESLSACRAIMVERGNPTALGRAGVAAKSGALLVLGEGNNALDRGAMIGILLDGTRVAFEVDLSAMRNARLNPSSKLLRLARRIVE